eukprot:XP_011676902.1 PREDICTED: uncharacterized protein LOC105444397 [Strongylocentrotus purpuratus]
MAGVYKLVHYVSLLIISELGLRVHATCNVPAPVSGTHHNGTLAVYQPGAVLSFSCDTGYSANFKPPTITCLDNGWNPANIYCELNTTSLVIAIIVAFVALFVFVVIIILLVRRKRRQTQAASPKIIRRSPKFPEHPPENIEMSRPGSLYDSVKLNPDRTDQHGIYDSLTGLDGIKEQPFDASEGLENPGLVDNSGIDIINAGGLNMTGARTADSSRSPHYENTKIDRQEAGVGSHPYENTALPNSKKLFH